MNNRHILLVDDEEFVRDCIAAALFHAGFNVTAVEGSSEALVLLEQNQMGPSQFDLLITDMNMPRISGLDLIDTIRNQGAELPAVVISGLGDETLRKETTTRKSVQLLSKPFSVNTLVQCVVQTLEHTSMNAPA